MKIIYKFGNGEIENRKVDDDYKLAANETLIKPNNNIRYPCGFDGENWFNIIGEIQPEYDPPEDIAEPQPSEADKQLAQLTYQQMMTTQDVTTLQTQNAQMAYQLMMQQGGKA